MIQVKRPTRGVALCLPLCALVLALGPSCKQKGEPEERVTVAAAASSDGVCDQFVTRLCARAGEKSPLCSSGKNLGKVLPASACQAAVKEFAQVEKQIDSDRKV